MWVLEMIVHVCVLIFFSPHRMPKKTNPSANPTSTWLLCMKYVIVFVWISYTSVYLLFVLLSQNKFYVLFLCRTAISWSKPLKTLVPFCERFEIWRSRWDLLTLTVSPVQRQLFDVVRLTQHAVVLHWSNSFISVVIQRLWYFLPMFH